MTIIGRFNRFVKNIRPTDDHINEANRQTDYMVEKLKGKVAADGTFKLEKVLKAGSNAKFTSLRRTTENIFDVDLAAYYSGTGATTKDLNKLLDFTCERLREIYPSKPKEDFEALKSAVRVKFRSGIKLNVDVAPIIQDDSLELENGGWLPRADGWRLTSVTCHNQFISRRTTKSNEVSGPVKFNRLVRLMKWWNNQQDIAQPSIFCDLITAAAFDAYGVTNEWQSSLRQVFSFLLKHQFLEPIIFDDYYDTRRLTFPSGQVVIMDSVNLENNIAKDWTKKIRLDYLARVQDAYDWMMEARSCELDNDEEGAVEMWCQVFGNKFRFLSEGEH
ncbi:CBASS oligonucleotide cyclase [Microcoleus sp.]|uniref:CBASS oligonucleotide cyclase n=1 Tax=Microcoleus sp. TaxID=44472 RepID=UPI003523578F